MNFINDDGFLQFFDNIVYSSKVPLSRLYINENNLTEFKATEIHKQLQSKSSKLFVDRFEKISFLTDAKMEKTLYINLGKNMNQDLPHLKVAREKEESFREKRTGLFKPPIRIRFGRKIWNKPSQVNAYMFIEFEDILSIANVTSLNAKQKILPGMKANIAGSNTYVQVRRSKRA